MNTQRVTNCIDCRFTGTVLMLAALLLCGCSNPESDFKKAEQANTEQAYNEFIRQHPDSPLVAKAKDRIENNAYDQAKRAGTASAYDGFLKRFQSGDTVQQARRELEAVEFSQAIKTAAIPTWEAFLIKYPQSSNAATVRKNLALITYDSTVKTNDIAAYQGFLTNYPDSDWATDIKSRLDDQLEERDWNEALLKNTRHGYESFSKGHPDSPRIRIAMGTMEGSVKIIGAGGRILMGGGDETFRIIATSNPNFPSIELGDTDALRLGFIPVGPDGDYSLNYQNRYIYNEVEGIALKEKSGAYRLIHFSCSRITTGPSLENTGGLTVSGGSTGHVRKGFIVGPPTLPP